MKSDFHDVLPGILNIHLKNGCLGFQVLLISKPDGFFEAHCSVGVSFWASLVAP